MQSYSYDADSVTTISPAAVIRHGSAYRSMVEFSVVDSDNQPLGDVEVVMVSDWCRTTITNVEGVARLRVSDSIASDSEELADNVAGVGLLGGRPVILEFVSRHVG